MDIVKVRNEKELIIKLIGRLDTMTAADLEEAVEDEKKDIRNLILDFEGLDYISSSGLRVILSIQKKMNGEKSMKICHVNSFILDIFKSSGMDNFLTIE